MHDIDNYINWAYTLTLGRFKGYFDESDEVKKIVLRQHSKANAFS